MGGRLRARARRPKDHEDETPRILARCATLRSDDPALLLIAIFWLGWALVLISTFLITHFELFGLEQVFARLTGRKIRPSRFITPLLYRYVRHPRYLGLLLSFWSVPVLSAGHLLFSAGASVYILIGIWFEERDLVAQFVWWHVADIDGNDPSVRVFDTLAKARPRLG